MLERFSNVVYWLCCIVAAVTILFGISSQIQEAIQDKKWDDTSIDEHVLKKCQSNDEGLSQVKNQKLDKSDKATDEATSDKSDNSTINENSPSNQIKKPWERYAQQEKQNPNRPPVDLFCVKDEQEKEFYNRLVGNIIPILLLSFGVYAFGWAFRYVLTGKKW